MVVIDELVARKLIKAHHRLCQFQMVPCKYENIGCEVLVLRKELEKHEMNNQQHLDVTIKAVHGHEETINRLDDSVERLNDSVDRLEQLHYDQQDRLDGEICRIDFSFEKEKESLQLLRETINKQENMVMRLRSIVHSQNKEICELKLKLEKLPKISYWSGQFAQSSLVTKSVANHTSAHVFKFTQFSIHKSLNRSVFSPALYTCTGGYKMCFQIHANGSGKAKGTHVSVYVFFMRGDNDDALTWPFTGTIRMELLNQLNDEQHHEKTVEFDDSKDDKHNQRVLHYDRASSGYGKPFYIPHSSLDVPTKNCQYLKDDCLYFRFEALHIAATRPWLSSAIKF